MGSLLTAVALGDRGDFLVVNHLARRTGWLHAPAALYAKDGVVVFGLLLVVGYLLARRSGDLQRTARAVLAGVGVLLAVAVNQPIVHAVGERRPYDQLAGVLVLVGRSADGSFPSDHAVMAGAAAAGLLLVGRRLGAVTLAAALLMAAARVYVGVHFPVDVVAGLAVGAAVALVCQLAAPAVTALLRRLAGGPLRPLLTAHEALR